MQVSTIDFNRITTLKITETVIAYLFYRLLKKNYKSKNADRPLN